MAERIALVTGANRGIGYEICRQLGAAGMTVILTARDPQKGQSAADALRSEGHNIVYQQLEVADAVSVNAARDVVRSRFGRLDVLVNNAAILLDEGRSVFNVDVETLRRTLEVNVLGAFIVSQAFIPLMRENGYGRVVNVSSGAGSITEMGSYAPAYSTSKAALNAMTRIFANVVDGRTIKVNAMCPGWVQTDMGGRGAPRSPAEGADTALWLATLPADGPHNGFFRDRRPIAW